MNTEIIYDLTDENLNKAAEVIKKGGLVAFPTETVYGLGANALDPDAAKKIYSAKGRPSDNPLIIHLAIAEDADKYACTNDVYYRLAEKFMPGPLTVIMQKRDNIPFEVTGGLESVAVRVPSDEIAHRFISVCGVPIAAPSANLSGKPSPTTTAHVIADMFSRIDMIIAGNKCDIGVESTIISLCEEKPTLLRPGKITPEELKTVCPDLEIAEAVLHRFEGRVQSPGMKYKHYAPRAKLELLDGSSEQLVGFCSDKKDCGILYYKEDKELQNMPHSLCIGSRDDPCEQAHLLFENLRRFDEDEGITHIYAPLPSTDGVGLAVVNRLIRAAGFDVIKL